MEADILKLEKEFQQSRSKEVYQLLVNKKLKYNTVNTYKIEQKKKNILRSKQRYYELEEKAHKILSWQLRKEESSRMINSVQTSNRFCITQPNRN